VKTEVVATDEFLDWWNQLDSGEQISVGLAIEMLEVFGVLLGFPQSSSIAGSRKLRELRIQHHGEPYRVLYAFDPKRNAVLLLGGNKTGRDRWYAENVPLAERIFEDYLRETDQK
jgi:hypothetical protein